MITLTIFLFLHLMSTFGETVDSDVVTVIFGAGGIETIIEAGLCCFIAVRRIQNNKQKRKDSANG